MLISYSDRTTLFCSMKAQKKRLTFEVLLPVSVCRQIVLNN
jgi:hypothetical protein